MQKTKIPWTDYSINPVKGLCPMACKDNNGDIYCYEHKRHHRFKLNPVIRYVDPFYEFYALKRKPPSRVFIGSIIELFGDWIRPEWLHSIFGFVKAYPQHTFIFLTKQPQNLTAWSPFPPNCYVGVSATNHEQWKSGVKGLREIEATVKFFSFEPLHHRVGVKFYDFDDDIRWVIIGSQTQPVKHPPREWVDEIIVAADKASIPVFVKEPMASHYGIFRQEYPCQKRIRKFVT